MNVWDFELLHYLRLNCLLRGRGLFVLPPHILFYVFPPLVRVLKRLMINNWLCFAFQGTGKTWTGVEIAYQFAAVNRKRGNGGQVLFCAPSNHAVDVAASKRSLLNWRNLLPWLSLLHSPLSPQGLEKRDPGNEIHADVGCSQLRSQCPVSPVCCQKKGDWGDSLIGN